MRLTAENKKKIRRKILTGAAALFRKHGVDEVNIDQIMAEAGLTRGAFYAHFRSKGELFAEVIKDQHPLLRMLVARKGHSADELWADMLVIFGGYMAPENHEWVFSGCTLASLLGDVTRAKPDIKQAYEGVWKGVTSQIARGQNIRGNENHDATCGCTPTDTAKNYEISKLTIEAALVLAVGAVTTAQAVSNNDERARILTSAKLGFDQLIANARKPIDHPNARTDI